MSDDPVIRRLHENYARLRARETDGGTEWPDLEPVVVAVSSDGPFPPGSGHNDGAWRRVAAELAASEHGWARHRSGNWWSVKDKQGRTQDPTAAELGPPLFGEWVTGARASVHLRPDVDKPHLLRFWTYTERDLKEGDRLAANEFAALRQEVWAIVDDKYWNDERDPAAARAADRGIMRPVVLYQLYWAGSPCDPHGIRRAVSRFAGFAEKDVRVDERDRQIRRAGRRVRMVRENAS